LFLSCGSRVARLFNTTFSGGLPCCAASLTYLRMAFAFGTRVTVEVIASGDVVAIAFRDRLAMRLFVHFSSAVVDLHDHLQVHA